MGMPYLSREDMNMRLNGTICTYEGVPYIVYTRTSAVTLDKDQVMLLSLGAKSTVPDHIIDHKCDKFITKSPQLGYINVAYHAMYVSRIPYRRQNQGLSVDSVFTLPESRPLYDKEFNSSYMRDCILGDHPSFEQALHSVLYGKRHGCAFHRDWAIINISAYTPEYGWDVVKKKTKSDPDAPIVEPDIGLYHKGFKIASLIGSVEEVKERIRKENYTYAEKVKEYFKFSDGPELSFYLRYLKKDTKKGSA